jgi:hypothetical protein
MSLADGRRAFRGWSRAAAPLTPSASKRRYSPSAHPPRGRSIGDRCHKASLRAGLQISAHAFPAAAVTQNGTARAALAVCDAEIQFTGPATVVALFRDAVDMFARPGEPRWAAVERLLRDVIRDWQSLPAHRDPVFARGGWRCAVPACSGRRRLHDHHVLYRSRGGGNALDNRLPVCMGHHLQGIHTNVIRASGTAPHDVYWELGIRVDGPPFAAFVGDRYAGSTTS